MRKIPKKQYNQITERSDTNLPEGYENMTYEEKMKYWANQGTGQFASAGEKIQSGFGRIIEDEEKIMDEEGEDAISYARYGHKGRRSKRRK